MIGRHVAALRHAVFKVAALTFGISRLEARQRIGMSLDRHIPALLGELNRNGHSWLGLKACRHGDRHAQHNYYLRADLHNGVLHFQRGPE